MISLLALGCSGPAPQAPSRFEMAMRDTAKNDAQMLVNAIELYTLQKGACPPSLAALVEAGVIQRLNEDPWRRPYALVKCAPGESPVVRSLGRDANDASDDIVVGASP